MDGENNGKPYEQMDDLGGKPTIFGNIHITYNPIWDPESFPQIPIASMYGIFPYIYHKNQPNVGK